MVNHRVPKLDQSTSVGTLAAAQQRVALWPGDGIAVGVHILPWVALIAKLGSRMICHADSQKCDVRKDGHARVTALRLHLPNIRSVALSLPGDLQGHPRGGSP